MPEGARGPSFQLTTKSQAVSCRTTAARFLPVRMTTKCQAVSWGGTATRPFR